jgi:lysophospholipase
MRAMKRETRELKAEDGTSLHVTVWHPDEPPRFRVLVSHGQSEHVDRHAWLAEALVPQGVLVFGPDHRGEGRSGGRKGHVEDFRVYAEDLARVCEEVEGHGEVPTLLFAHSMGGLIGLTFLLDHGERLGIRAAVVSAPLLGLALDIGFVKRMAARVGNLVMPTMEVPSDLPASDVLRDPDLLKEYEADPHRTMAVTPRWASSMEKAQLRMVEDVGRLEIPMLWYAGTGDKVCCTPTTKRVFESLPRATELDQIFRTFEGVYHEPHNEPPGTREEIREFAATWLLDHAG